MMRNRAFNRERKVILGDSNKRCQHRKREIDPAEVPHRQPIVGVVSKTWSHRDQIESDCGGKLLLYAAVVRSVDAGGQPSEADAFEAERGGGAQTGLTYFG
ncbi:hypothetical protein [Rubripirellula amarantea]|uniref:hypothetical protein n=1 Tax=Rubripirellula amarantea TaxID=2527999 RepID=UPI001F5F2A53|nr:hypothetical protein [Rubripirellula amarantea]